MSLIGLKELKKLVVFWPTTVSIICLCIALRAQNPPVELIVQKGHSRSVLSVIFSPDGKTLASGSEDGTIKLWEVNSAKLIRTLSGHSSEIKSAVFSPDSKMLIAGTLSGGEIKFWEASTGQLIRRLSGGGFLAISPDGKVLASQGYNGDTKLWEISSGQLIRTIKSPPEMVSSIAFSPDGKILAVAYAKTYNISLWEVSSGQLLRTIPGVSSDYESGQFIAFSPDGKILAARSHESGDNGVVNLLDVNNGQLLRRLIGPTASIQSITFSPDGKMVAAAGNEAKIFLWETNGGKHIRTLSSHSGWVYSIAFSPDGKLLASGSGDATIKLWEASNGQLVRTLSGNVRSIALSPDGKILASGGKDTTIKLWDANTGQLTRTLSGSSEGINTIAFDSDGKMLASGSNLWDASTGKLIRKFSENSRQVAFSPDGKMLATSWGSRIKLCGTSSGQLIRVFSKHSSNSSYEVRSVAFSPDGKMLAAGQDRRIELWRVNSGQLVKTLSWWHLGTGYSPALSVAFSSDGKMLAAGSYDRKIYLWEASSGQLIHTLSGHSGGINSTVFSPDGKMLASGSDDKTIKLWETSSGQLIRTLSGHSGVVTSGAFSPDGKRLLSGDSLEGMRIWSVETGALVATHIFIGEEWIIYTSDNYYSCSAGAAKYISWKQGDKSYDFSVFSAQFNKPEIVAARLRGLSSEPTTIATTPSPNNTNTPADNTEKPKPPAPTPEDTTSPKLVITSPSLTRGQGVKPAADRILKYSGSSLTVTGQATDDSGVREVTVRGVAVQLDERGNFSAEVPLQVGDNQIAVMATDAHGNHATVSFTAWRESEPPPVTGRYFALVIGNNRYPHLPSTQQLKTAINDAQEVAKLLRADYGFEIKLLPDAKRVEIINAMNEYRRSLKPDDNLLIYYAGHGHFDKETDKAYWIPTDGERSSNANWIIADDVTANIRAIPSRHILIVSDSCYSGTLARATDFRLSTPAERERYLEKMRGGKSRLLMASGGNEPVADGGGGNHSVFARAWLDGLRGMEERVFTAEELFYRFIKEQVAGKSNQAPEYRYIQASGHDSGDFVFARVK